MNNNKVIRWIYLDHLPTQKHQETDRPPIQPVPQVSNNQPSEYSRPLAPEHPTKVIPWRTYRSIQIWKRITLLCNTLSLKFLLLPQNWVELFSVQLKARALSVGWMRIQMAHVGWSQNDGWFRRILSFIGGAEQGDNMQLQNLEYLSSINASGSHYCICMVTIF